MPDKGSPLVEDAKAIFRAAVRAVQAPRLLGQMEPGGWGKRRLEAYDTVHVVGMGKAAMAMAGEVERRIGDRVEDGVVVVPTGYPESFPSDFHSPSRIDIAEGGHPLPSEGSVRGARRILEFAEGSGSDDLLLVLVSGGGTALSTLPAAGLELSDLKTTYRLLLESGMDIHAANAVRKHLTAVGGGQLAQHAEPAEVTSLIVSDVVGDDISVIASGPTAPDSSSHEDAIRALYRFDLWHDIPEGVRTHLTEGAKGKRAETPGPEAVCFESVTNLLLVNNGTALRAAAEAAKARGYRVRGVGEGVEGEARHVGTRHAEQILEDKARAPSCWLWGGETTVSVTGDGTGGRNQEVALGAAIELDGADRYVVFLSGGTDGIDGPTDAAGAWVTPHSVERASRAGYESKAHLDNNDSYALFQAVDQLLTPGPTHTNVMDVQVGLSHPRE